VRSVADLEADLAVARAEAQAEAERQAAEAKRVAAEQRRALAAGKPRLEELERALATALAATPDDDRGHLLRLRGPAREWLHGPSPEVPASLALLGLVERDSVAGRLHELMLQLGRATAYLTSEAGLDEASELVARADDAEVAAWRALMGRVRFLAGEIE
jgi:hypothetical protein